ncbi:MAG: tetratricopeptide repeat protein [Cellulosilyticaceae bacterium]
MQVICPNCGKLGEVTERCTQCQEPLGWIGSCYQQSQKYYIKGYDYAAKRQLTQAIPYLQKAISLNKQHIEAQNVLGLVYYELGQVGEALKAWILSTSISRENNSAEMYMEQVQKQPKKLEMYKETIHLYNRALRYLEKKNDDMAVIRLKKAVSLNPRFVEARNLLALCYLYEKQPTKAKEQIIKTLEIDKCNEKALYYLKHIELQDEAMEQQEEPIIQSPHLHKAKLEGKPHQVNHKGAVGGRAILYFVFGMLCMFIVQSALIVPAKTEEIEGELYAAIGENSSMKLQLDTLVKDSEIALLEVEQQKEALQKQYDLLQQQHHALLQEKRIDQIGVYKKENKWVEAAELLYTIAPDSLSAAHKETFEGYKKEIYPKATDKLYSMGYQAYKGKNDAEAMSHFEKAMLYGGNSKTLSNVIYYMGEIEESNGNAAKAIQYYQVLEQDYKGTSAQKKGAARLKKLQPEQ